MREDCSKRWRRSMRTDEHSSHVCRWRLCNCNTCYRSVMSPYNIHANVHSPSVISHWTLQHVQEVTQTSHTCQLTWRCRSNEWSGLVQVSATQTLSYSCRYTTSQSSPSTDTEQSPAPVFYNITHTLTPWLLHCWHMCTAIKHPVPDRVNPSFIIFDIQALWRSALSVRVPGCQKLQMTA